MIVVTKNIPIALCVYRAFLMKALKALLFCSAIDVLAAEITEENSLLVSDQEINFEIVSSINNFDDEGFWLLVVEDGQDLEAWKLSFNGEILVRKSIDFSQSNFDYSGLEENAFELKLINNTELLIGKIDNARTVNILKYDIGRDVFTTYLQYRGKIGEEITFIEFAEDGGVIIAGNILSPFYKKINSENEVVLDYSLQDESGLGINACFSTISSNSFILCGNNTGSNTEASSRILLANETGGVDNALLLDGYVLQVEVISNDHIYLVTKNDTGIGRPNKILRTNTEFNLTDISNYLELDGGYDSFSVSLHGEDEVFAFVKSTGTGLSAFRKDTVVLRQVGTNSDPSVITMVHDNSGLRSRNYKKLFTFVIGDILYLVANVEHRNNSRTLVDSIEFVKLGIR